MNLKIIELAVIGTTALIGQSAPATKSNTSAYFLLFLLALGFGIWLYFTLFYKPKRVVLQRYTDVKEA
jgi:hypothetical protein